MGWRKEKKLKLWHAFFLYNITLYFLKTFMQFLSVVSATRRGQPAKKLAGFPLAPGPSCFSSFRDTNDTLKYICMFDQGNLSI